ncbi:TobH protein [Mycolicibacterium insubricum]|jgi:hypothetical protein|uniref:TobH protein n=1 Tax=Mycolicibacterium insubricum TaxID=444597 RepID=A0A1X0D1T4_9MYCO|nr:TobH protein [Mycolicibacterium insubricum]MCB9440389.1 TobH protein [Mycolicibacterium sp.]ORA66384.1 TobH protein [Mycolicibacterium insubricum]BBZ66174.1 TobH protein [Mycolicibacterium insubricum]
MNLQAGIDVDDTEALIAADRDGLLRGASMSGAQVRAVATAVAEGALAGLGDERPRAVVWVTGRGPASAAGAILAATLAPVTSVPVLVVGAVPPWIGALDLLIVAGDDPGDPALVGATATGVYRGARVVVAAPFEGPLRDAGAGRVALLDPRLWVPDGFGLSHYLAAGLAAVGAVDPAASLDLNTLADDLDAETLRNSAAREMFTNAAKVLAHRISTHRTVLAGDTPATTALARHGAEILLRVGHAVVGAAGLTDALVALRTGLAAGDDHDGVDALFRDDEIDGPAPLRPLVLVPALADERGTLGARIAGYDDIEPIGVTDIPSSPDPAPQPGRPEQQLAVLAVRLEMAAVYLRLVAGSR